MANEPLPEDSISAFLEARQQKRYQSRPNEEALHGGLVELVKAADAKEAAYAKLKTDYDLLQTQLQNKTIELERLVLQLKSATGGVSSEKGRSSIEETPNVLGLDEIETAFGHTNPFIGQDFRTITDHSYVMNSVEQEDEASLGTHLLVEFYGCPSDTLKWKEYISSVMHKAVEAASATLVGSIFHEWKPYGAAGVAVIQESHFSIHTWPEHGFAALDFFYCGYLDIDKAVQVCCANLQPKRIAYVSIKRGLQTPVDSASGPILARVQFRDAYGFDKTEAPAPVR